MQISEFFKAEYVKMTSFVKKRIKDSALNDSEDIVQEVFTSLFDAADISAPIENLSAYIYRALRNRITDILRKKPEPDSISEEHADSGFSPEGEYLTTELNAVIYEAVDCLPEAEREVFVRTVFDGHSFREIAEETGIPIGTLLWRKSQAVKKMRQMLERYGPFD